MNRYRWVEKQSSAGNTYYEVEDLMRIPNEFLDLIVYIYPSKDIAEQGERIGGTGFIAGVRTAEGNLYLYVVTNAHTLHTFRRLGAVDIALRFNTHLRKTDVIVAPIDKWYEHPKKDDLAIFPLEPAVLWKYSYVTEDNFIRKDMLYGQLSTVQSETAILSEEVKGKKWVESPAVGVGWDTVTIGRFEKHGGRYMNIASARYGHISMLPYEPVPQPVSSRGFAHDQDSYLVESFSVNGFSGSPVLVQLPLDHREINETGNSSTYKERVFLLGIDWGHFDFNGDVVVQAEEDIALTKPKSKDDPRKVKIKVPCGMMCVVPAWQLSELLHTEELEMQRKDLDKLKKEKEDDTATADTEISKEEFDEVLKKVSRKTKTSESDQPKPKT